MLFADVIAAQFGYGVQMLRQDIALYTTISGIAVGIILMVIQAKYRPQVPDFRPSTQGKGTIVVTEPVPFEQQAVANDVERHISIEDERWELIYGRALILEVRVRIRNGPRRFQITSYSFLSEGAGQLPAGIIGDQVSQEVWERTTKLNSRPDGIVPLTVAPGEDVSFWVVNSIGRRAVNIGGTPGYTLTIHDAEGNEFPFVRPAREKISKAIADLSR